MEDNDDLYRKLWNGLIPYYQVAGMEENNTSNIQGLIRKSDDYIIPTNYYYDYDVEWPDVKELTLEQFRLLKDMIVFFSSDSSIVDFLEYIGVTGEYSNEERIKLNKYRDEFVKYKKYKDASIR